MPAPPIPRNRSESPEDGFVLLAVLFMVVLVLLSLAVAAPRIAASIQRDREIETIHRGEQYKRAIRLYYRKFGNYPSSIDQLENTNNIRFLRKRYLDPLTGKDDWKVIPVGQAHVCPLGFFGQPLGAAATLNGATSAASLAAQSSGLNPTNGLSAGGSSSGTTDGSTTGAGTTGTGGGAGGCGGQPAAVGTSVAGLIAQQNGQTGSDASSGDSATPVSVGSNPNSGLATGTGSSGALGGAAATGATLGGAGSTGGFGSSAGNTNGGTLGGIPMMGVEPVSEKSSILAYKLKTKYNQWEFAYWGQIEEQQSTGNLAGGGSTNINGSSVNGAGSQSPGLSQSPSPSGGGVPVQNGGSFQ